MVLQQQAKIGALVPIKASGESKSRLNSLLSAQQCGELARHMVIDVLDALTAATSIDSVTLLGDTRELKSLAEAYKCKLIRDVDGLGLSGNLNLAAQQLQAEGLETLLIAHSDLPLITSEEVDALVQQHENSLTFCAASRDGGTNALLASPPTAIKFCFGVDSCARHVDAAREATLDYKIIEQSAFAYDIDTPADLAWLCAQTIAGYTGRYLEASGIMTDLTKPSAMTN